MGTLKDEIEQLIRAPSQETVFGLAAWTDGLQGLERQADEMDEPSFAVATRQLIFAMIERQRQAIVRLAEEIEGRDASC